MESKISDESVKKIDSLFKSYEIIADDTLVDNVTDRGGMYRLDGSRFAIISTIQSEDEL